MTRMKQEVQIIRKGSLFYIMRNKHVSRFRPWLGDSLSFLYDFIMNRSVFPKKFGGDMQKHYAALSRMFKDIHGKRLLELGTGSGSAVHFLKHDNDYTGVDVSPGLLKQAVKRFAEAGFQNSEFYIASADDLPFENGTFDLCLCILSLNFIGNVEKVFQEISRLLIPSGLFVCCVPVPEKKPAQSTIRGDLYSEMELKKICQEHGLIFEPVPCENGALVYFKAVKEESKG